MTTASKGLFAYFLSLIGLDRVTHSASFLKNAAPSLQASSSSASFMTESTLVVNGSDVYDEKGRNNLTTMAYDAWSLQTMLSNLPKIALCSLLTSTALKYPKVMQMIANEQPATWMLPKDDAQDYVRETQAIKDQARRVVHSLDGLRPSEQFARETEMAQELQRVVRFSTNTLHASPQGHSLVALVALMCVAKEGLCALPEVSKYIFGRAHLGRLLVLEMAGVLKNYKASHTLLAQWPNLLSILDPPKAVVAAADPADQLAWLMDVLSEVCAQMHDCDRHWAFGQEYENVVNIAARNCRLVAH
ncbi:hypothetical protein BX666DRAFT_1869350 [Dichotomocladium elegans]|nr:hypothetical protein BX666DRAFT_1869350 [Dichotomocladium elegans]